MFQPTRLAVPVFGSALDSSVVAEERNRYRWLSADCTKRLSTYDHRRILSCEAYDSIVDLPPMA
jgi:hypothetical protein